MKPLVTTVHPAGASEDRAVTMATSGPIMVPYAAKTRKPKHLLPHIPHSYGTSVPLRRVTLLWAPRCLFTHLLLCDSVRVPLRVPLRVALETADGCHGNAKPGAIATEAATGKKKAQCNRGNAAGRVGAGAAAVSVELWKDQHWIFVISLYGACMHELHQAAMFSAGVLSVATMVL